MPILFTPMLLLWCSSAIPTTGHRRPPCKTLVAAVAARGEPMSIVSYPNTYHDFDNPALTRRRVREDVPNGVRPGKGVTTAPNPEARADALKRVGAFFAQHLK